MAHRLDDLPVGELEPSIEIGARPDGTPHFDSFSMRYVVFVGSSVVAGHDLFQFIVNAEE